MPFDTQGQFNVENFLKAITPWESGYLHNTFAYLAVKRDGLFVVAHGALWLNTMQSKIPFTQFASENVRAGNYRLSQLGKTYRQIIDDLATGIITTPEGDLHFPADTHRHSASFTPLHPSALQSQSRVNVLRLGGTQQFVMAQPSVLDWELRASRRPYDSPQDILSEYQLGGLFNDVITVEVIATAVMAFDGEASRVRGDTGTIAVRLAKTLQTDKAAVAYRLFSQGKVMSREFVNGPQFTWTQADNAQVGTFNVPVPSGAILHCYSIYNGVAQTHWYISDPTTSQNSRRTIFESFDAGLAVLNEFLSRSNAKGRDARDLEAAVCWLFWMLGFGVAHLGSTARTQDFSDAILTTPEGHVAVVECTTGLLRAENKLPNLIARSATVRRRLDQSNHSHLKLLPVIVTTLTREEIKADLEQAEKLGVLVLAKEELSQLVDGTMIAANAETMYAAAEKRVRDAQEYFTLRNANSDQPQLL